jgi:hypothetical protein
MFDEDKFRHTPAEWLKGEIECGELVSGSRDRFRLAQFSFQSTEEFTEIVVGMMQSMSAKPKSNGKPVSYLARARVQHLPSADLFFGHSPSQEANAEALRKRERSVPTSHKMVWAVTALIPGTFVRSTPNTR